ncbi:MULTISPECIES: septum site-determining protein MinC [Paracoccus]|uniref:Probable septum site-determining protein MinC n=1 Tax=Paracoccus kondratievae TaxID=135740 RepID=A0AAD3NZN6_9RHOB|nr:MULTISPECIES: septum site-determining protein MinC [Paracoccus]GLK64489.1 putative septum site-determining protein MinC [Paracoccus kondratievae]SMG19945.1 septum site-determining protein MinC [Paracoccus sp. J56]
MQSGKSAAEVVATVKPFQIRGRSFTAVALHLTGRPDRAFFQALEARLNQTPLFFENAPLVIDLELADGLDSAEELMRLTAELRRRKLSVFGIQSGTPAQARAANEAGLISLPAGRDVALERVTRQGSRSVPATPAPAPKEPANRMVTQPVRSGQTVFADRGDLVIVGSVSSGAEVIAAGNIHIYGRLRGRALAGVNGDTSARIFCHALDAELLAIAGLYRTSENLGADTPRQYVQVYLQGEVLRIESLK